MITVIAFYCFDFRETENIILATNRILYSLDPNEQVVLFLLSSNLCQRMSENLKRLKKD